MRKLSFKKSADDKFKKISVTLDYTVDERNIIKKYVLDAKKANEDVTHKKRVENKEAPTKSETLSSQLNVNINKNKNSKKIYKD